MFIDAAIDYDNTYTANPKVWTEILLLMKDRGMKVICMMPTERNYPRLFV